jgi:hypothetical protein
VLSHFQPMTRSMCGYVGAGGYLRCVYMLNSRSVRVSLPWEQVSQA